MNGINTAVLTDIAHRNCPRRCNAPNSPGVPASSTW